MVDYAKVPVFDMTGEVQRYVEYGIGGGDFLQALFSNNLVGAVRCDDILNTTCLREWVAFMVDEMPAGSYGSSKIVDAWTRMGGAQHLHVWTA